MRIEKSVRYGLILSCLLIALLGYAATGKSESSDVRKIYRAVLTVHGMLKPGAGNNFVTRATLLKGGYGHCGHYAQLMLEQSAKAGMFARLISVIDKNGQVHTINEVLTDEGWIVADAMNGVVYPHSFHDLLSRPELANDIIGAPEKPTPIVGPKFFDGALLVNLGKNIIDDDYRGFPARGIDLSRSLATITRDEKKITYRDRAAVFFLKGAETVTVKSALKFDFVQINTLVPISVTLKDGTHFEIPDTNAPNTIPVYHYRNEDGSVTLKLASGPGALAMYVSITPLVPVEQMEKYILPTPPHPSVFVFRGPVAIDVDRANLVCDGLPSWSTDLGTPQDLVSSKNMPSFFPGRPENPWTDRKQEAERNFRTTVPGVPSNEPRILLMPYLVADTDCKLQMTYRNRTEQDDTLFIGFPDGSEQKLADLPPGKDFQVLKLDIAEPVIKKFNNL